MRTFSCNSAAAGSSPRLNRFLHHHAEQRLPLADEEGLPTGEEPNRGTFGNEGAAVVGVGCIRSEHKLRKACASSHSQQQPTTENTGIIEVRIGERYCRSYPWASIIVPGCNSARRCWGERIGEQVLR